MLIPRIVRAVRGQMSVAILVLSIIVRSHADDGTIKDTKLDVGPDNVSASSARQFTGRQVFDYRKNGIRVDVKIVPTSNNDSAMNDGFPKFPTKDIGLCIIDFSLTCAKNRLGRFLESVRDLNEIHLMGQQIKLVKIRVVNSPRSINESNENIRRSIDDIFDTFALRITLPRWNGKREKNQIDVMLDETALVEGRGKGGGGGGGGGGKKGGKGGGGGGCKMMIMAGLMMLKMKIISIATLKGMMMAGMSLMVSMAMLMQKYMKGGGYQGGGGGQYKEIVLLTKSTGGPSDGYGAPPPSTGYGPPTSYGGGGGWGRSFGRRFITTDLSSTTDLKNSSLKSDQPPNLITYKYPNSNLNFTYPNWNYTDRYYLSNSEDSVKNNSNMEPLLPLATDDYSIEMHPYQNERLRDYVADSGEMISYGDSLDPDASTKSNYITNEASDSYPMYNDEWQSTRERISSLRRDGSTSSTT